MDGSSHFFNYSVQDDRDGRGTGFDVSGAGGQQDYRLASVSSSYAPNVSAPIGIAPRTLLPAPLPVTSLPTRPSVALAPSVPGVAPGFLSPAGQMMISGVDGIAFGTPGLSSGSSATPETRSSTQMITPETLATSSSQGPHRKLAAVFPPPPVPPPPPRRRKPRKQKPKEELTADEEEARRDKGKERNRVAATKCRQKKKEWMSDLEETKDGLESQNSHLQMEYNSLAQEVSQIRAQLMTHANCGDGNINKWIENEAKRFVLDAGERFDAMLATFGQAGQEQRHPSMSSASEYPTSTSQDLMSPITNRGSISLPHSAGQPSSPVLFRGSRSTDSAGRQMASTEPSAFLPPAPRAEDRFDFEHLHVPENLR